MFSKLPPIFKNFYFIAGVIFLSWMIFLDSNDFISRYQMSSKLNALEAEKEYYLEKISEVEIDRKELLTNKELLEKYAREKYLMKKESEEIFVITEN